VSELCLGAMTFGRETTEEDSFKILDHFVEAGGNFIDTADVYSAGISEEILGRWLKG
jgi:aryl-alcohol dehydrogenase-like predicted oxidoreductase